MQTYACLLLAKLRLHLPALYPIWEWLRAGSTAALVTVEIAGVGAIIAWRQLVYAQQRDKDLDIRNGWTETHKLIMTFRFKREILNAPFNADYPRSADAAIAALESLHNLKGQLDRMPDCPLVEQIADFLNSNWQPEEWRSPEFVNKFDEYAKQVALLTRPATQN
jgi:hypothetical protein